MIFSISLFLLTFYMYCLTIVSYLSSLFLIFLCWRCKAETLISFAPFIITKFINITRVIHPDNPKARNPNARMFRFVPRIEYIHNDGIFWAQAFRRMIKKIPNLITYFVHFLIFLRGSKSFKWGFSSTQFLWVAQRWPHNLLRIESIRNGLFT